MRESIAIRGLSYVIDSGRGKWQLGWGADEAGEGEGGFEGFD